MVDARRETPVNPNTLSPIHFKFILKRSPHLNFNIQNINVPGIHAAAIDVYNPLVRVPFESHHLNFDDLLINFLVDENMENYLEIWEWMRKLHWPNSYDEYSELTNPALPPGEGLYSDISLIIMNSSQRANMEINYKDAFPVSLSSMIFDVTKENVDPVEAACTFRYTSYTIERLNV